MTAVHESYDALLRRGDYLPNDETTLLVELAQKLQRPLLIEGPSGSGKTALAYALGKGLGVDVIRLSCYEGLSASEALYDWNYNAQWASLTQNRDINPFDDQFLLARPLLKAIQSPQSILLIDEVDRADEAFEALLLEYLSDYQISIPERGTMRAARAPITILTSNRQRPLSDALRRRCVYLFLDWPDQSRENAVVSYHVSRLSGDIRMEIVKAVTRLRSWNLLKPPGLSETIDWAQAAEITHLEHWTADWVGRTLGLVIKDAMDLGRVRERIDELVAPET